MKLTKFVHSCVLVEDQGNGNILFDPGAFSWVSGLIDLAKFPKLDFIIVSHKHPDHFNEDFALQIIQTFPDASWIVPSDLVDEVKKLGVKNVSNMSSEKIELFEVEHAKVSPFGQPVKNIITNSFGKITHPGDTHQIIESKDMLFMPFQAPWGTTINAIELVLKLKPNFVLPIHDWMWNDQWRNTCYDRFQAIFDQEGIRFLRPTNGQSIEIEM